MVFTKERWKRFSTFCWKFFGVGSFWPILAVLILSGFCVFNSIHRYSQSDVDEIRVEYESEVEAAHESGYQDGYDVGYNEGYSSGWHDSDSEHEGDYDDGHQDGYIKGRHAAEREHQDDFSDGYDGGYGDGYRDGFSDAVEDPSNYNGPYLPDSIISADKYLSGIYG